MRQPGALAMSTQRLAWFRTLMAAVLLLIAVFKILDLLSGATRNRPPDPILGASLWLVTSAAAGIEICLAVLILFGPLKFSSGALLALGAAFTSHGVLMVIYGIPRCSCLGVRFSWAWMDANQSRVALALAVWMLLSGTFWLLMDSRMPVQRR